MQNETLVIDRVKWYRGKGGHGSALLRAKDHLMCCLGFCLLQRGFSSDELLEVGTPGEMPCVNRAHPDAFPKVAGLVDEYDEGGTYETETCEALVDVNDDPNIDDATREKRITKLFAEIGITVQFIN